MRLLLVIGLLQEAASFSTTGCSNPASYRARPALGLVPLLLPTTVRLNTKARPVLAKTFPTMPWSTLAAGSSDGIALSDTRLEKLWWFFWRSLWKGMTLPFPALRSMVLDVSQPQNASVGFRIRESLAAIVAYLGIGVLAYYCVLEPTWTVVDALYFTVTCFTTVGYGDLCPSTPQSQTFTALFGILGVAFLGAALATLSSKLVQTQVEVLQAVRETSKQRIKALFEQVSPLPMSAATTSTATTSHVSQSNWQSPDSTRTADTVLLWRRVNALVWTLVRQILPPLLIIVGGAWLVHHLDAPTMMTRTWRDVVYYAVVTGTYNSGQEAVHKFAVSFCFYCHTQNPTLNQLLCHHSSFHNWLWGHLPRFPTRETGGGRVYSAGCRCRGRATVWCGHTHTGTPAKTRLPTTAPRRSDD